MPDVSFVSGAARVRRALILPALLVLLAACGSSGGGDSDSGLGSLFGSSEPAADPVVPGVQTAAVASVRSAGGCPSIEVLSGTQAYRVYDKGLEDQAMGLRYQASFAETARECSALGAETAMRIGIIGRVLVGPKGGPGRIDVPLRIAVVDDRNQPVYSKAYKIPVQIGAGQTQVAFTHVEEGVLVPAGPGGYRILVGFDDKAAAAPARRG